jgi:hypothetical protein
MGRRRGRLEVRSSYVGIGVLSFVVLAGSISGGLLWLKGKRPSAREPGSAAALNVSTLPRTLTPFEVKESVYDGKLAPGWEDWGWGPHDLPATGPARISFAGYGGIILHHQELPLRFGALVFRLQAPESFGHFLSVSLALGQADRAAFPAVAVETRHVAKLADGWSEIMIPWHELNPAGSPIDRIVLTARKPVGNDWVLLDKIALTQPATSPTKAAKAVSREASVAVRCDEVARPISPLIYGVTTVSEKIGAPANRIGGNPTTRMNWDLGNVWNTGSDWFFENVQGQGDFRTGIYESARRGVQTALVVPLIGWVAKDATSSGFPVSKFGAQRKVDPYRPEAGDGHAPDGKPLTPGPPTQTSVAAPPELIGKWIRGMRERDAAEGVRGVNIYILDNEPALWHHTHRDVHPEAVGYDELLDRTVRYGSAVRAADPGALIAGPAEWGWTNYFTSAKDPGSSGLTGPDRLAHGGKALIPWYLERLFEHEKRSGTRILDMLDVHFYPAAADIFGNNARVDPDGAALRLRSTRALWDPAYKDESWIGEPVRLIPRLKEWVAENYPGLKIGIGEWNFGAEEHISGALATAEALGRFGQQGLDAAFYLGPKDGGSAFWAFRAFRNFDGEGGRFLDHGLRSEDAPGLSVFASRDADTARVVAILLNLDQDSRVRVRLNLDSCGAVKTVRTFRYTADSGGLIEDKSERKPLETSLPPYSIAVLDFRLR